jgi:hypothetical protein
MIQGAKARLRSNTPGSAASILSKEAQAWLGVDAEMFYDKLIAAYTDIIEANSKILGSKSLFIQWSTIFLAVDVITIFMIAAL